MFWERPARLIRFVLGSSAAAALVGRCGFCAILRAQKGPGPGPLVPPRAKCQPANRLVRKLLPEDALDHFRHLRGVRLRLRLVPEAGGELFLFKRVEIMTHFRDALM